MTYLLISNQSDHLATCIYSRARFANMAEVYSQTEREILCRFPLKKGTLATIIINECLGNQPSV